MRISRFRRYKINRIKYLIWLIVIIGLFPISLKTVYAQQPNTSDKELQHHLVELIRNYHRSDWEKLSKELRHWPKPIVPIFNQAHREVDSLYVWQLDFETGQKLINNKTLLNKKINKLCEKRIKDEYDRLTKILKAHKPAIKIKPYFIYFLDQNQKVTDIHAFASQKRSDKVLTPEIKTAILEILHKKEFHAYEATYRIRKEHSNKLYYYKSELKKFYLRAFKKRKDRILHR